MKFTLSFDLNNDAFTEEESHVEIARILREAAQRSEEGFTSGYIRDYNGNSVGFWERG